MKASFPTNGTIKDLRDFNANVYGLVDDRYNSIFDLFAQEQRFAMRALKGVRKNDSGKTKQNLLIALSWFMAISNRLHIIIEDEIWSRFPYACSYCGKGPCVCAALKPKKRLQVSARGKRPPQSISEFQEMFAQIYPAERRTLEHAGIHFAEELGEVGEALHNYLALHQSLDEVKAELADLFSCFVGVANSLSFDMGKGLAKLYKNNCPSCHTAPCTCTFEYIAAFKS